MKLKKYAILTNSKIVFKDYSITLLRKSDIQNIRKWRNEQMNILRQTITLTVKDQLIYYNKFIKKSFYDHKPNMILFSFLLDKDCIGYGGLVHIDWNSKSAEISFINNTNRSKSKTVYVKDLTIFLKLVSNIAFNDLKLNKITTETYDVRPWTIMILKKYVTIDNKLCDSILHYKFINS
jgi:hypothetical protein